MAAITWRNVNGPSLAEASRPLESAQRSFDGSFSILNDLLKQREATDLANTNVVNENNKNAYLDAVAGIKKPDDIAAQADALAQLRSALNPAGRAATRDAVDSRESALQQRTITDNQFKQSLLADAELPSLREGMAIAASGDGIGLANWQSRNPGHSKTAEVVNAYNSRFDANRASDDNHAKAMQDIAASQAQAKFHESQIAANAVTARNTAENNKVDNFIKLINANQNAVEALQGGKGGADGSGSSGGGGSGLNNLGSALEKLVPDASDRNRVAKMYATIDADPSRQYMLQSEKLSAAISATDTSGYFRFSNAKPLDKVLEAFDANPAYQERVTKAKQNRDLLMEQAKGITRVMNPGVPTALQGNGTNPNASVEGSRAYRNSNPGNLKFGDFAKSQGATGQDDQGFAIFPDKTTGDNAQRALLQGPVYRDLTIASAISKYAPASDNNDTGAYIRSLADAGLDVNKTIGALSKPEFDKLIGGIQKREGWIEPKINTSQASAAILGKQQPTNTPAPVPTVSVTPTAKQSLKQALPEYNGKAVKTTSIFQEIGGAISGFAKKIDSNSRREIAKSVGIFLKDSLDNGTYVGPGTIKEAQMRAKIDPEQFDPKVLDWLNKIPSATTEAQKKTLR